MRILRPLLVLAALIALLRPEPPRYAAERRLRVAGAAFQFLLAPTEQVPDTNSALDRVAELALSATRALPGDPRPWTLAGSAQLTAGRGERALELYRSAFTRGERAEIDMNLGRAFALLERGEDANGAFLRGGWVSPALLEFMPPQVSQRVRPQITHLEAELAAGRLTAPPPAPSEEANQ